MSDDEVRRMHLELVTRSFAAVSRGDVDAQLEVCTDDVVLELPYADPPVRLEGKEAIRAHVGPALQIFSFELQIRNVFECRDPDTLILEYTSEGQCTTTGQPYSNSYIGVIVFRDGRICAQREYYNPLVAATALQPQGT
jgi:ketosteroid isomerase-like protein